MNVTEVITWYLEVIKVMTRTFICVVPLCSALQASIAGPRSHDEVI